MSIIADISVVLAWLFEEKQTPQALKILQMFDTQPLLVPPLWWAELENGILMGERRGRITTNQSVVFLNLTAALPIQTDAAPRQQISEKIISLGRRYQLISYDAAYLELAVRSGASLATFDKSLRKASRREGVKLLPTNA